MLFGPMNLHVYSRIMIANYSIHVQIFNFLKWTVFNWKLVYLKLKSGLSERKGIFVFEIEYER
jgi:hypothetical protein